jgi:hypothetical protein
MSCADVSACAIPVWNRERARQREARVKDELPAILPAEPVQYSSISGFYDVFVKALLHNFVFALKRINNAVFYKFRAFRPLKSRTLFPEVL